MDDKQVLVTCPKCHCEFSVDEVLRAKFDSQFHEKLEAEKKRIWVVAQEKAAEKVKSKFDEELRNLKEENETKEKELKEARDMELKIRQEKVRLEEERRGLELKVQRQLDEEREKIRRKAVEEVSEEHRLKEREKEKIIDDLKKSLGEAQRRASVGSQQLQGEVLELELEEILRREFPVDGIAPVPKGISGADILQRVIDPSGRFCGTIIWESKRVKDFKEQWVGKLKEDMRTVKADVAMLVSLDLPADIKNFGPRDGVYVMDFENFVNVAKLVRLKIIELCYARMSAVGKEEKKEILWNYLTGMEFRQRIEAIVEAFNLMKGDLDKERQWLAKHWQKREKQIQVVIDNTLGMHGDLHGLMGRSLPEIASLEVFDEVDVVKSSLGSASAAVALDEGSN